MRRAAWGLVLGAALNAGCGGPAPPPPPTPAEEKAADEELKRTAEQERHEQKGRPKADPDDR